jgi:hypothetical protein
LAFLFQKATHAGQFVADLPEEGQSRVFLLASKRLTFTCNLSNPEPSSKLPKAIQKIPQVTAP